MGICLVTHHHLLPAHQSPMDVRKKKRMRGDKVWTERGLKRQRVIQTGRENKTVGEREMSWKSSHLQKVGGMYRNLMKGSRVINQSSMKGRQSREAL